MGGYRCVGGDSRRRVTLVWAIAGIRLGDEPCFQSRSAISRFPLRKWCFRVDRDRSYYEVLGLVNTHWSPTTGATGIITTAFALVIGISRLAPSLEPRPSIVCLNKEL
jgi:hypothetical protein